MLAKTYNERTFFIMQSDYNTRDYKSQVKRIICKLATKKRANENVIEWLRSRGAKRTAYNIENCARNVGVTDDLGAVGHPGRGVTLRRNAVEFVECHGGARKRRSREL